MVSHEHSEAVRATYQQKAAEYDEYMLKCVPYYEEMMEVLIAAIPFKSGRAFDVCELGSGTGSVTMLLRAAYPHATIKCVDLSSAMTDMAKAKLNDPSITFEIADFYDFQFGQKYDVIFSSLALHHLVLDEDKKTFYQKIFNALQPGGFFINADVMVAANEDHEKQAMEAWKDWLGQYHSEEEWQSQVIDRYYKEDRPTSLGNHLMWMDEIGFSEVDVLWKRMKGAVYCGRKASLSFGF